MSTLHEPPNRLAPASELEVAVEGLLHAQREGRHADVVREVSSWLNAWPDNRDLLLIEATSRRHLGEVDAALATLARMERLYPSFSRLHQERGMCHVARRDAPAAISSLLVAVNLNPALPASWNMLVGLYRMTGDGDNAALAADHMATLQTLPPEVIRATSLFSDGDLALAEAIVRAFLLRHGNHPEAMRLLARIGLALDVLDDAETLLEAVLELLPDYRAARYDYAQTLIKRQRHTDALIQIDRLLTVDPANLEYRTLAATAEVGLGHNDRAIEIYRGMLADSPASWDIPLWLGHALKTVGQTAEAVDSYRAAAMARPDFGDAWWSLANLKTFRFTDDDMARMTQQEAAGTTRLVDRYHLCFALGKASEDRGEAALAWSFYDRGNGLKRSENTYVPEVFETNTREQIRVCTAAFFAARADWGDLRPDPIFILGLPRAGSTLLEQILASHSQVEGTQELANIQRMVLELQGSTSDLLDPRYPASLEGLDRADVARLGARFLEETRVYRTGQAFFIDKMPNNFRHIGLIHLMLPNARIIDARRDPMSCCFSNFKQLFAQGQEFTYGIEDIARYYRTYLDLMDHWDRVLPGRVLRVQHEDVVNDLEGSVRRLLDYCGLPFENACVNFHKTQRSVRTPSSEQVRQPIFRDGLDQWRNFEPWLDPLKAALGDALERYRAIPGV
jgi:tetratricopeptide (TPR) repeat protein